MIPCRPSSTLEQSYLFIQLKFVSTPRTEKSVLLSQAGLMAGQSAARTDLVLNHVHGDAGQVHCKKTTRYSIQVGWSTSYQTCYILPLSYFQIWDRRLSLKLWCMHKYKRNLPLPFFSAYGNILITYFRWGKKFGAGKMCDCWLCSSCVKKKKFYF